VRVVCFLKNSQRDQHARQKAKEEHGVVAHVQEGH